MSLTHSLIFGGSGTILGMQKLMMKYLLHEKANMWSYVHSCLAESGSLNNCEDSDRWKRLQVKLGNLHMSYACRLMSSSDDSETVCSVFLYRVRWWRSQNLFPSNNFLQRKKETIMQIEDARSREIWTHRKAMIKTTEVPMILPTGDVTVQQ